MNKLTLKGKFVRYNPETGNITINIDPLDPERHASVEYIMQNFDKYLSISVSYSVKNGVHDILRKSWYASLHAILKANEIYPDAENIAEIDNRMRESYFPICDTKEGQVPEPKRMRQMSVTEMQTALKTLQERHSYVNFVHY